MHYIYYINILSKYRAKGRPDIPLPSGVFRAQKTPESQGFRGRCPKNAFRGPGVSAQRVQIYLHQSAKLFALFADAQALELVLQGLPLDAQESGRPGHVPAGFPHGPLHGFPLQAGQIAVHGLPACGV